jgi:2-polyprenyl-3-methyl-5-hydroxy-6-metoxy-1,4-benzoquinol methylase
MEIRNTIKCPICNNTSVEIKNLTSDYILNKLSKHFNVPITTNLEIIDYKLMKCNECDFEFAYPPVEGSDSFYNWIVSQSGYYTASRWEYSKVAELISNEKNNAKILDVGCGDGQFFDHIVASKHHIFDLYGIDKSIDSVKACQKKGYNVFCTDIQNFKVENNSGLFDVVVSFHCLEHIANPKEFIEEMVNMITPLGALYVSTPYSPMDFEIEWYDVLNHPPHHLGRYNLKTYQKIGEILGLKTEVFMPKPRTILMSSIISLMFSIHGNLYRTTKIRIAKTILNHPYKFFVHLYKQSKRTKIQGKRAPNVILIKFTKK